MTLVLNQWVTVGSAPQTKTISTPQGDVDFTLNYYLEARLTSQSIALNRSYGDVRARITRSGGWSYRSSLYATCSNCPVYSGTVTITDNVLTTGTFTLYHEPNGEGALLLEGDFTATIGGYSMSIRNAWQAAPTIPRASKPTYSSDPLTIGQTQTITTNRASDSFTHTLEISVGGYTETIENVGASTTWTPATATLMPYMDTWQKEVTVTCTTYNGTATIGSSTTSFKLQVDTSVYKPVISYTTPTDVNMYTMGLVNVGSFIKGYSTLNTTVTASVNDSTYGDEIAQIEITLGSTTQTYIGGGQSTVAIFNATPNADQLIIKATDSRGYTVTETVALTVINYSKIQIQSIEYVRVNSNDVETETGEYIRYTIKVNAFLGSFGRSTNTIAIRSQSKLATAQAYDLPVTEQTITTSGSGMGDLTITGVTVGTYLSSSQYDIVFTLADALSNVTASVLRIHEGVPVYAWGEDHFDVYGEFHVHDREDVTKYTTIYPNGYRWNLLGSANGSTAVALDLSNYSEVMLVAKYTENATYTWASSTVITVAELSDAYLYCFMPSRIAQSTATDFGCVVRIKEDSANLFEFNANRSTVLTSASLNVYAR